MLVVVFNSVGRSVLEKCKGQDCSMY